MQKDKLKNNKSISIKTIAWTLGGFGVSILIMLIVSLYMLSFQFDRVQKTTQDYVSLKLSALEVQDASDYLTEQARSYVVTGEDDYIFNYMNEGYTLKNREKALDALNKKIGDTEAYKNLAHAVNHSKVLMNEEFYAMKLTIIAFNKDYTSEIYQKYEEDKKHSEEVIQYVMPIELTPEDAALSVAEKKERALTYVYGSNYSNQKDKISQSIIDSITEIDKLLEDNVYKSSEQLKTVLIVQQTFILILVIFFVLAIVFIRNGLIKPVNTAVEKIIKREFLESRGLKEYRYLVDAYNEARMTSINNAEKLTFIAEHDNLTGVYNRAGYDKFYKDLSLDKTIYILVDIDDFKSINDNFGHDAGDMALKRLSSILLKYFPDDFICRLGGDEFAILVFDYEDGVKEELIAKFIEIEKEAMHEEKGLPSSSFSIGVAFGTKGDNTDTLYRKADKAMYAIKGKNKNGYCFYEDIAK